MKNLIYSFILSSLVACGSGESLDNENSFFPKVKIGTPSPIPPLSESLAYISMDKEQEDSGSEPNTVVVE